MTSFDDIAALSERLRRGFLVTRRPDGSPTVHPLTPIYAEGSLFINTYRKSAKVRHLQRDPQMAYVVMTKEEDEPFRAFEVRGRARILELEEVPESFLAVGTAGEVISEENLKRVRDRLATGKRVYLRVEGDEWTECEPPPPPDAAAEGPDAGAGSWRVPSAPGHIAMSQEEIAGFLGDSGIAVLGTVDGDGHPRGRPARYLTREAHLDLLVADSSPSLGDLAADPRACATVEEFPTYNEIRGVMAHGRADVTGGPVARGSVRLRLEPDRLLSFDFSKIARSH